MEEKAEAPFRGSLSPLLRQAAHGTLPRGWIYLPEGQPGTHTEVLFIPSDAFEDVEGQEAFAREQGFPREGLERDDIESIYAVAVRDLSPELTDDQLLEAFLYYWRYDAFLPKFGAPSPPSRDEVLLRLDREFYDMLGDEDASRQCRTPGCSRGTVQLSVFCRKHHFEMVRKRPCPFE